MGYLRIAAVILATLIMLTIVLMVAAVFIGFFRMSEYNARYSTVRTPRYKISDLYPSLKTGDLILFVATTHAPANSILTQTFHSHAGILLREGELVYISEAQPALELMPSHSDRDSDAPGADYRMRRGADLLPLLVRLKYYTGVYYILRLSHPLGPEREELLKREAERLRSEQYPYPTMAQILFGILLNWKTQSRHCFQHVAHLLDAARLTPVDRDSPFSEAGFSTVCSEICEISGRPLPDGYTYHDPVQIIYDIGTLDPRGADSAALGPCPN